MGKVIKFPVPAPEKFGPERAKRTRREKSPQPGQLNLFAQSSKVIPLHRPGTFEEALMFDEQGNYAAARESYLKAVEEGSNPADACCNLGILESSEGNISKAINYFTRCLKEDPRHKEGHYNLANIYAEAGNLSLAKIHYEIAIEIDPEFPNSYFNLGLTLAMSNKFAEAVEVLSRYREIAPAGNECEVSDLIEKLKNL